MKHAVVVGAGIAGLCTAVGLRNGGWHVTVLERRPEVLGIGAALGLWPDARNGLWSLGLGPAFDRFALAPARGGLYRPDGRALVELPAGSKRVPPVRLISRARLMAELLEAARGVEIHTGAAADAPALRAALAGSDLLVGADGIDSAVRAAFFRGRTRPRYSGLVAWRGVVDGEVAEQGETWGDGALFGITPIEPGRTNFYAAVPAPEGNPGTLEALRTRFAGWHAPIPHLLADVDADQVLRHPVYDLHPPLPGYVSGRVALLGDAAHAMTPHLGRGACEAINDAACLVGLANAHDVPEALARYDRMRRRTSQKYAARSWRMMRLVHARRLAPVRDGLLRAAGSLVR